MLRPDSARLLPVWPGRPNGTANPLSPWPDVSAGGIDELYRLGIDAVFGIAPGASSLNDLLADAASNVTRTTEQIVRVMRMK